jgi:hypothetical protein
MIYILGCDHNLQNYDLTEHDEEIAKIERLTKEKFYELTKEIVVSNEISFVGEECKQGQETIPRAIAGELACAYAEIDMTSEERASCDIARNYQALGQQEKDRVYVLREDYMVERTYSESTFDVRKLIVCGAEHLKGLQKRFELRGENVRAQDLTREEWFGAIYKKKVEQL